jgi:hypothetical protein
MFEQQSSAEGRTRYAHNKGPRAGDWVRKVIRWREGGGSGEGSGEGLEDPEEDPEED